MKMNEKENGRGRGGGGVVGGINRSNGLCEESCCFSGRTDCRCPSLSLWLDVMAALCLSSTAPHTQTRCAAAVQSLGRLSAPNRPPDECNMSLRNARPVPRRLAS
jgi:hypothetical protein